MAPSHKIVAVGDVNGEFSKVFSRLEALNQKQNFAFAIIVGNLFADPDSHSVEKDDELQKLLNDTIKVPFPTYFSLGTRPLPGPAIDRLESTGSELCPKLNILGRSVSIRTVQGFRILAVGGAFTDSLSITQGGAYEAHFTRHDVEKLTKEAADADILVTSEWPENIRKGSRVLYNDDKLPSQVSALTSLVEVTTPRYHLSASPQYFEREPFSHPGEWPRKVTRFISLAPYGNNDGQKWIYAFSLSPGMLSQNLPSGCTTSPFLITTQRQAEAVDIASNSRKISVDNLSKRKSDTLGNSSQNFRFSNGHGAHGTNFDRGRNKRSKLQPITPKDCFFCLGNEKFKSHMLVSVADASYATIAKGPLTTPKTFPDLGFSCHMLLIPHSHVPTVNSIPDREQKERLVEELKNYRVTMQKMIKSKAVDEDGNSRLGVVTWAVERAAGVHLNWQLLPLPVHMVDDRLVEVGFDVEAENMKYPRFIKDRSAMSEAEERDHFKVTIWSDRQEHEMVLPLDDSFRFDLQFGRRVLAKLLGLESRMDWHACQQSEEEEMEDAEMFKAAYQPYEIVEN